MHRLITRTILALAGLSTISVAPAARAGLVATYQFHNSLTADEAGAPALVPLNGGSFVADTPLGQSRTVYQRTSASNASADQSALRLDTTPLGLTSNNYAVEIVFTFTDNLNPSTGYRRIVDSYDPSNLKDPGFYVGPGSTLNIFQGGGHSGGAALSDGTYYDVVLSVSPTGEQAYLNGSLAVDYAGTPDSIATHFLTFFQDEVYEYGNGKVALIRVFDSALSAGEVLSLNNQGNPFPAAATVPEPSALISGGLAALVLAQLSLRRRRAVGTSSKAW